MVLRVAGAEPTTAALALLLVVLALATAAPLWAAVVASVAATASLNYFFLPPLGTFQIADPQNLVALVVFVAVAVAASQLSAKARARARDAERAALSATLLASLSHSVRTPVTAIRTALSNLESGQLSEDEERDQAALARGELERLGRLFDEILDMARIDAGGVRVQRRWVTPAEVVDAAVAHAAPHLTDVRLRVQADEQTAAEVDPRLTASALAHLLENAARYAHDNDVEVRAWTEKQRLRFAVKDTGAGVRASEIDKLFEPFFRGEDVRQRIPGTGMGLAIARGLLAAQRGRVWVEHVQPSGACFSIEVPARVRGTQSD
jgi:two-component system sensor histidine kinase KdpD